MGWLPRLPDQFPRSQLGCFPRLPDQFPRSQLECYPIVNTGKVGQSDSYDVSRMAKIDNSTEADKVNTVSKNFSQKIQHARNSQKLSQKELAHKMNVPFSVVNQYEKGTAIADGSIIQKFKNVLGI